MAEPDGEITKLFKVRRTVLQMLRDRGYRVEDSELEIKRDEFILRFGNPVRKDSLFFETDKGPKPADKIYVFYPEGPKVGVPVVRNCASKLKGDNVFCAILVVPAPISAPARQAIVEINKFFSIEIFEEAELVTNITHHKLINQYWVLTDDEKKKLLDKYTVQETALPRIQVSDPVAKYYGLKRGQIVKIKRTDATSKDYCTYRVAV